MSRADTTSTLMGLAAILIWSTNIAVSRSLAERVGAITAGAAMFLIGGALGCLVAGARGRLGGMLRLPRAYLLGGGGLFVGYMICLYLAIRLAATRQQTLEVAILNYLWPGLTLLLAIPLLGTRVRPFFPLGLLLGFAGAALAPLRPGEYSLRALAHGLAANPWPYVLATAAAVLWAAYSAGSRRWAGAAAGGAVPLFALAAGLALAALRPLAPEAAVWSATALGELLFMALLPALLAYSLWDRAMRRGNVTLVAALAYLIPVLSTAVSSLYLGVVVSWNLWLAAGLLVAGGALCERAVVRPAAAGAATGPAAAAPGAAA